MDQGTNYITRKYILTGRVQGVGFRWFTKRLADKYAIKGYVQNQYDGSVLVVAQGTQEMIDPFERALSKGPSYAWVDKIRTEPPDNDQSFQSFKIK
jgi:acylphosphatase